MGTIGNDGALILSSWWIVLKYDQGVDKVHARGIFGQGVRIAMYVGALFVSSSLLILS